MEPTRITELAQSLRANCAKTDYPIATREQAEEIAAALDELVHIKSAAQNEVVEKIAGNHKADAESTDTVYAYRHKQPHKDRGVLLDALRAKEGEVAHWKDLCQKNYAEAMRTLSLAQKAIDRARAASTAESDRANNLSAKLIEEHERANQLTHGLALYRAAVGPRCAEDVFAWELLNSHICPCPWCFKCCRAKIPALAGCDCSNTNDGLCACQSIASDKELP